METCKSCNGHRRIVKTVPNIKRQGGVDYHSHNPAYVDRLFVCESCKGSGIEPDPTPAGMLDFEGLVLEAPAFTERQFAVGVAKARKAGYMSIRPMGNGAVRVDTGKAGSVYTVTRAACDCAGGRSHGRCYHRAACIWLSDVAGVNLCRDELLGFTPAGQPVTAADRLHELEAA